MAKTVKLINPGPASLLIVNPTGGTSKMRKRKSSSRVKRTRRHNPYSASTAPKRRRSVMHRRARRRNPSGGFGLLTKGLTLAGGGALTQFVTTMVPSIGGPGALADAARTAGVAYLLGMLANKIGPLSRFSQDITLGGMAVAGGKVINSFILPPAQSVFLPRPAETAPAAQGVKGIGIAYPGLNPYRAYSSGMNGIGIQTPGMVPYGAYADDQSAHAMSM